MTSGIFTLLVFGTSKYIFLYIECMIPLLVIMYGFNSGIGTLKGIYNETQSKAYSNLVHWSGSNIFDNNKYQN
jgi:hypothetical protein